VANAQLTDFQQMTVILSHEISEGITDPNTQTGWFDPRNGEIGDIAEGQIGNLDGYVVQAVWSQAQNQILVPSDTSTTLQVNATVVQATAGQAFTSLVATITGTASGTAASSFSATIDWGDGVTSAGTITSDPNGGFDITGTNTYAQTGSFAITVTVRNQAGAGAGTALSSATVAAAAATSTVNAKGTVLAATTGQQFSGIVATFTDTNANAVPGSFTATIDWGDGTSSTGTVSVDSKGGFDISGTHTYAPSSEAALGFPFGGSLEDLLGGRFFVVTVTIQDSTTSAAATVLSLAKVAAAPPVITVQGQNISATAGQSFSGVMAKFNAANTSATAGDLTATILGQRHAARRHQWANHRRLPGLARVLPGAQCQRWRLAFQRLSKRVVSPGRSIGLR
jgi:hypothetical protein